MGRRWGVSLVNVGGGRVVRRTQKAALIYLDSDEEEHWVPMSALGSETRSKATRNAIIEEIYMAKWFAEREAIDFGLEELEFDHE